MQTKSLPYAMRRPISD